MKEITFVEEILENGIFYDGSVIINWSEAKAVIMRKRSHKQKEIKEIIVKKCDTIDVIYDCLVPINFNQSKKLI